MACGAGGGGGGPGLGGEVGGPVVAEVEARNTSARAGAAGRARGGTGWGVLARGDAGRDVSRSAVPALRTADAGSPEGCRGAFGAVAGSTPWEMTEGSAPRHI